MLIVDKPKVTSFAKRYLILFAIAVGGWELAQFTNGESEFGLDDLVEAGALFIGLSLSVVLLVSFFQGWIEFRQGDE
ncbi:MAG: hypothetical protein R3E02_14835 [Blastomonas sp.]